jgi:hypothetical protein
MAVEIIPIEQDLPYIFHRARIIIYQTTIWRTNVVYIVEQPDLGHLSA